MEEAFPFLSLESYESEKYDNVEGEKEVTDSAVKFCLIKQLCICITE